VPVHFRETLHPGGDPPMTFDYEMRPGVATTVNALKLMELVGLRPEET
jgi:DNA mismatch repair ATPase MutS